MTKVDLLDSLFAARDQVTRIIIYTVPTPDNDAPLKTLVQKREQLSATIARVVQTELLATAAQLDDASAQIDTCTAKLNDLAASVENATHAIAIVNQIVGIVATVISIAAVAA